MTSPSDGAAEGEDFVVSIQDVRAKAGTDAGEIALEIVTNRGTIPAAMHPCEGRTGCVIFIGGAGGGTGDGPADGVYRKLAGALIAEGVTSLRIGWRDPDEFHECVLDTLAACSFLKGLGGTAAVIVGHSMGGAVAIKSGQLAPLSVAVAALSPQRAGAGDVDQLGKPLLLIHGSDDRVLLPKASEDIYERAKEPKRLVILEGGGHSLQQVADEVYRLLYDFITDAVGDPTA